MFTRTGRATLLFMAFLSAPFIRAQQQETDEQALIEVKDGISISKDSLFLLNLRFRMQNRLGFTTVSGEDLSADIVDARVRRLRLRLDGFVLNRDLRYYIQLNFSRNDLDLESGTVAQPVRDAMVYYHFNRQVYIGFGQSKLPGNRQRVISSGNLQFADRSIANAAYTLDRDFGAFAYWTIPMATQQVQVKGAFTTGDGRGALPGTTGMAYTGRVEWLPLGVFTKQGDYSEGDLEFEPLPKLSVAATYSHNDRATRTGGQLGAELYSPRDINTFIADMMFKYKGWAMLGEFFDRTSETPITANAEGQTRAVNVGRALSTQVSKIFPSKYEFALRYSLLDTDAEAMGTTIDRIEEFLLGSTKYLNGHRIKLQLYVGYRWLERRMDLDAGGNAWTTLFQVEFGI
ncbi:MAG: porin [Flavobacteriales bacterium]|nr:porin [Flavobacteriales bacterium]